MTMFVGAFLKIIVEIGNKVGSSPKKKNPN